MHGTWGHRSGSVYAQLRAAYPDCETMQALTTAGCAAYLELLPSAELSPVGDAWHAVYRHWR